MLGSTTQARFSDAAEPGDDDASYAFCHHHLHHWPLQFVDVVAVAVVDFVADFFDSAAAAAVAIVVAAVVACSSVDS